MRTITLCLCLLGAAALLTGCATRALAPDTGLTAGPTTVQAASVSRSHAAVSAEYRSQVPRPASVTLLRGQSVTRAGHTSTSPQPVVPISAHQRVTPAVALPVVPKTASAPVTKKTPAGVKSLFAPVTADPCEEDPCAGGRCRVPD
jgi:hypothetical protein